MAFVPSPARSLVTTATSHEATVALPVGAIATFDHHRGPVTGAAHIPGTLLAGTAGYDGAVGLAHLDTCAIEVLGYHDHLVNAIAASPDGRTMVSCSSDHTLRVWDPRARACTGILIGHEDDVESFAYVDATHGVSASRDHRLILWDLLTGDLERQFAGHEKDALSVSYLDGAIWSSGDDMTLRKWDISTGHLVLTIGPFDVETDTCDVDRLRHRVVLGSDDGHIRVFDSESGNELLDHSAHASGIKKVAVNPRTGDILSAAYDQRLFLWFADGFTMARELQYSPTVWERSLIFSTDGSFVLGGTFDGDLLRWDLAGEPAEVKTCAQRVGPGKPNPCLNDLAVSDGTYVTVSDDGIVRQGTLLSGRLSEPSVYETCPRILMNAVAISGNHILAGTHDHRVLVFDLSEGGLRLSNTIALGEGPINSIAIAMSGEAEGDAFVATYSGNIIRLRRDGSIRWKQRCHSGAAKSLSLLCGQKLGVSVAADGTLSTWTLAGELLRTIPAHPDIVNDVAASEEGLSCYTVGRDFTIRRWDVLSGDLLACVALPKQSPKTVVVCGAEGLVVVGTYWGDLVGFHAESGSLCQVPLAFNGISSLVATREGLLAASYDGALYLVRTSDLAPIDKRCFMRQRPAIPAKVSTASIRQGD